MTTFTDFLTATSPAITDANEAVHLLSGNTDEANAPLAPVNLHAIGYEKAEHHRGNANALENLLNRVLRGYLVDEGNDSGRRQAHERRTDEKLLGLGKQAENARTAIRKINGTDLPALRDSLADLDEEILQIRRDEAAGLRNPDHRDRMQLRLYGGLVLAATLFVFLFYVSAFYSAFFRDLAGELTAAGPDGQMSVLGAIFAKTAFTTLNFHWAGPLLLFAFGGFLHVLFENKTIAGRALLGLMLMLVAATDGLIAYFVEDKNHEVKVLMGLADADDHSWWTSPVFWLVIAMGFFAMLVWSGLLHAWMHEAGKKDVARLTALEVKHRQEKQLPLKGQINTLTTQLADLEGDIAGIELEIKALESARKSVVFSPSELEKYVTDFYDGWLMYVNNRLGNDTPLRDACDTVIRNFYARHLNG